jgi:hypothetical protein
VGAGEKERCLRERERGIKREIEGEKQWGMLGEAKGRKRKRNG